MRRILKAIQGFSFSSVKKHLDGLEADRTIHSRALRLESLEQRTVLSISVNSLVLDANFPEVHAIQVTLPDLEYHFVDCGNGSEQIISNELTAGGESGSPELPGRLIRVLLPSDTDLSSVTLQGMTSVEQVSPVTHKIKPVDPLVTDSAEGTAIFDYPQGAEIVGGKNALVYGTNAYYGLQPVTLGGCEQMGRYKFADVYYSPFAYNPVSGSVKAALDVGFSLNYRTGDPESAALLARTFDESAVAEMFVNSADAAQWYPDAAFGASGAESAQYVILTTSAIASGSLRLADFITQKQADGFTVQVVTESSWGGGTGDAAAEHIRSWLSANYASMGIQYVMLVGNPNPSNGDVPMKMTYPRSSETDDRESPTDYYYADLTSNWNSDGDGMYGEFASLFGGDFSPTTSLPVHEVYVGRIPVYNADYAALDGILMKTINYERESDIAWRKNMLLPMAISNYNNEDGEGDSRTDGSSLAEKIKNDLATPNSFGTYTMYEKDGRDPVSAACDAPISKTNLLNAWKTNSYGIVDWWAHGGQESASRKYWSADSDSDGVPDGNEMTWADFINSSDAVQLNNARPSIVTEVSCQNAWPENPNNLGYSLLKNGAIGTYSGTRNTWYTHGTWSASKRGDNASYAYYITQRLVQNQTTETLGAALQWCRENLSTGWLSSSATYFMNRTDFNLYGDPSIKPFVAGAEAPEMDVLGNSKNIVDGDTTPSVLDSTDYGSVNVALGTQTRTYTIKNYGNAVLNLGGSPRVVISGANASDFTVTTQPSSNSVAPGNSGSFIVRFDPSAPGLRTATVSIVNNDANESLYDFAVQGTGLAPEIGVQGNGQEIADGDTTPNTADYTDFGSVSAASGAVSHTFTIRNTGTSSLTLNGSPSVAVSGANASDFTVTAQPPSSSVAVGSSTTFTVQFDPSGAGLRTATISFINNDSDESPYDFAIQGVGLAPEIIVQGNGQDIVDGDATPSAADFTDFGSVDVASGTQSYTFTIQNSGSEALTLTGSPFVEITGENAADFTVIAQPSSSTVDAGSFLTFTVQFDPSTHGLRTAAVRIVNSDADESPYDFTIQGIGLAAEINVQGNGQDIADGDAEPGTADFTNFGSVDVISGTQSFTFTIQNSGNEALTLGGSPVVQITGENVTDFTVTAQPSNSTVDAGGFLTFTVEFDPHNLGLRTATIGIANGDSDENLYDFAIQGTGFLREMTFTWDGGGADALWSTAENWVGDLTPLPGSDLVFPADAKQSENINDFYSLGIQIDSITVSGGNYSIQNSTIVSTTVEVRQGAALTASSIVCDTLIIGSAPEAAAANATNDAAAQTAEVRHSVASDLAISNVAARSEIGLSEVTSLLVTHAMTAPLAEKSPSDAPSVVSVARQAVSMLVIASSAGSSAQMARRNDKADIAEPLSNELLSKAVYADLNSAARTTLSSLLQLAKQLKDSVYGESADSFVRTKMQPSLASPTCQCARDLAMQSLVGSFRHNIAIGQLDTELLFGSHFRKQDKLVANLVDGFYADLLGAL